MQGYPITGPRKVQQFVKYKSNLGWFCLRNRWVAATTFLVLLLWWACCLPSPLFRLPYASELLARDSSLLSAGIAADGQWRMPPADRISPKLYACIVTFEDRRFYSHPGIDPAALLRAIHANIRAGKVVSGGSTLTMQVARMARGNRSRNLWQKLVEAAVALRLETAYSKVELLGFWLNNAPFGGNAVGIVSACRRYYGRDPADLSWSEAATLAVLPNRPGLIHPGRNRDALRSKRDALLRELRDHGALDEEAYALALLEPLPNAPLALPRLAPHLLERRKQESGNGRIHTDIIPGLQQEITDAVLRHHRVLAGNQVHNLAVLVSEVATGKVVAYVGNVPGLAASYAPDVDLITARRSPGSLLKPLLYGLALDAGMLLPSQLLPDVPSSFQNFRPANFYADFDGAVPADEALARSLNIPFVYLLQEYGVPRFLSALHALGFRHMEAGADHYGLSLILGGAEITMEEIHGSFLGQARQLRDYRQLRQANLPTAYRGLSAGATFTVFNALRTLQRPDEYGQSVRFESHRPVAWKTGTSFGFRDAWAVGATPEYVVSVWAGNADGEGRPGLVGVRAAAPLLFDVFRLLEAYGGAGPAWFEAPEDDLLEVSVCSTTGFLATADCPVRKLTTPRSGEQTKPCPFHRRIFISEDGSEQTRLTCSPTARPVSWLVLPALQAHFYQRRHPEYLSLPPWSAGCVALNSPASVMQLVYPEGNGVISASKNWEGQIEPLHFEVAHPDPGAELYWHVDGKFTATTRVFHQLLVSLPSGQHDLNVVDQQGNHLNRRFQVQ